MRIDKTYSELWDLANTHEDIVVYETVKMAINTLQKLQKEIDRLEKALDDIYSIAKYSRPDLVANEVREIAWKALV